MSQQSQTLTPGQTLLNQQDADWRRVLAACDLLGREASLDSILSCGVRFLEEYFHMTELRMIRLEPGEGATHFRVESTDMVQSHDSMGLMVRDFIRHLKKLDLTADNFDGINHIKIDEKNLDFALIGDLRYGAAIIFWQVTDDQIQEPQALELYIQQLQQSGRWLARVIEAQNLLHIDDLTGLYNHRYMELSIEREIKRSQRYTSSFCLLFIDLDNFKPINDQFGHLAGSQVLREVAQILRAAVRDVDLLFRYGGDEFVVLLIESDARAGFKTGQRIRERIQQNFFKVSEGRTAQVTASIGVAAFPEHATEKERLLTLADECMYDGKRHGKNQVVLVGGSRLASNSNSKDGVQAWSQK